jgi:hypothetical protein
MNANLIKRINNKKIKRIIVNVVAKPDWHKIVIGYKSLCEIYNTQIKYVNLWINYKKVEL